MKHPWLILVLSAGLEAVWANALAASASFTKPVPVVIFVIASIASVIGLSIAMKSIPTGTAYAVWTSLGSVATVGGAWALQSEQLSVWKIVFLAGIVGCVVGLKILEPGASRDA